MRSSVRIAATVLVVVMMVLLAIPGTPVVGQAKKIRAGLVYDVGGRGDKSFNDMAYEGLARAQKEFAATLQTREMEPTVGGENREELLRLLAG
jgi:basic membrane lipoprotein Med (substrate-binding protein (PBP1-ABC) superfamily)